MNIFLIDTSAGRTVREAETYRQAHAAGRKEYGTAGFRQAQRASLDDLVAVKRAGGWLPLNVRPEVEARERVMYPPNPNGPYKRRGRRLRLEMGA